MRDLGMSPPAGQKSVHKLDFVLIWVPPGTLYFVLSSANESTFTKELFHSSYRALDRLTANL